MSTRLNFIKKQVSNFLHETVLYPHTKIGRSGPPPRKRKYITHDLKPYIVSPLKSEEESPKFNSTHQMVGPPEFERSIQTKTGTLNTKYQAGPKDNPIDVDSTFKIAKDPVRQAELDAIVKLGKEMDDIGASSGGTGRKTSSTTAPTQPSQVTNNNNISFGSTSLTFSRKNPEPEPKDPERAARMDNIRQTIQSRVGSVRHGGQFSTPY